MGFHYKIYDNSKPYFITTTIVDWVQVFAYKDMAIAVIESLSYCQRHKGLEINAWCLMPDHLHMIVRATDGSKLSDIIRDFKRHTSKKIIDHLIEGIFDKKEKMLNAFKAAIPQISNDLRYKVWRDGYHPIQLHSGPFIYQKLRYIHNNPVKAKLTKNPTEYLYSSARNYAKLNGLLDVTNILELNFAKKKLDKTDI